MTSQLILGILLVITISTGLALALGANILHYYEEPTWGQTKSFLIKTLLLNVFALLAWIVVYLIIFALMALRRKSFREIVLLLKKRGQELEKLKNLDR